MKTKILYHYWLGLFIEWRTKAAHRNLASAMRRAEIWAEVSRRVQGGVK